MLVLTRKLGEKIVIGDDVIVSVLEISGSQIKLGIQAPRRIAVHRNEVYEKIQQQNRLAAIIEDNDFSVAERLLNAPGSPNSLSGRNKS